MKANMLILLK